MKKRTGTLLILLVLLILSTGFSALAEEDVPVFKLPEELAAYAWRLTDDDPDSRCTFGKETAFTVTDLKNAEALFIEWYELPDSVRFIQYDEAGNVLAEQPVESLYETMLPLESTAESVDFVSEKSFSVSECCIPSAEDIKKYIPLKQPEKADLMTVLAHNGDETRFLPGLTVLYSARGAEIVPVYFSAQSRRAIRETIEVCRLSGIENQPVFLGFKFIRVDERYNKARVKIWKKEDVLKELTAVIRRYRPEIVVTHSEPGEDADCVNRYAAELVIAAVEQAASGREPASFKLYGSWEVSKLYEHAAPNAPVLLENGTVADGYCAVDTAILKESTGMTGCEFARELMKRYRTLDIYRIGIEEQKLYFRSVKSAVGPDAKKNDLFENVPVVFAGNRPVFAGFGSGAREASSEDADAGYFLDEADESEDVIFDSASGHWSYKSNSLSIGIECRSETKEDGSPLVYYIAHIRMRNYDSYRSGFGYYLENGSAKSDPWIIARRYKAVLAITGDNLVNNEKEKKGVLIRNGQLYSAGQKRMSTMALCGDMTLKIYDAATDAQVLVDDGIQNSYGFGPILVENGIADPELKNHRLNVLNPRCGIGMVSPGHYVAIVADGRQRNHSVGFTLEEFADAFIKEGCTVAYNMDGGISAGMVFMGEHINRHLSAYSNSSSQRPWPDALLFGYSPLVPDESDPIDNNGNWKESEAKRRKLAEQNGNG